MIEVVVVIALLALLTGLTLGAIQKARALAERSQCQGKLRQIGFALHHYHDTAGRLPVGVSGEGIDEQMPFASWCLRLLPFLERATLWDQAVAAFKQDLDFLNDPPHSGLRTTVTAFTCPSDPRVRKPQQVGRRKVLRAFTSYLGVNGYSASYNNGILFLNSQISLTDIVDGTSNTLAVGERPPSHDLIFGWWYAGWGQDKDGEGDMLLGVRTKNRSEYGLGCPDGPYDFGPGQFINQCDAFHFWSPHSGGGSFLMADSSVRFLQYSANEVIIALASRAGGEAQAVP